MIRQHLLLRKVFLDRLEEHKPSLAMICRGLSAVTFFLLFLTPGYAFQPMLSLEELSQTKGIIKQIINDPVRRKRSPFTRRGLIVETDKDQERFNLFDNEELANKLQSLIGREVTVYWQYWWLHPRPDVFHHVVEDPLQIETEGATLMQYDANLYRESRLTLVNTSKILFFCSLAFQLIFNVSPWLLSKQELERNAS